MDIDPSKIVQHDSKKLQMLYKSIKSSYKKCLGNFRTSGTHDSDFYNFCCGSLDVLYLHLHIQNKPGTTDFVLGNLPEDVFVETEVPDDQKKSVSDVQFSDSSGTSAHAPPAKRAKRKKNNDVAEAIHAFVTGRHTEIAQQKLEILRLKENRLQEIAKREKEAARIEKEDKNLQYILKISEKIRKLRAELSEEKNEDNAKDIADEIEMLKLMKKEKLGFQNQH